MKKIDYKTPYGQLTNQTPSAPYGFPVLHRDGRDYGPASVLPPPPLLSRIPGAPALAVTAGDVIRAWRDEVRPSSRELAAGRDGSGGTDRLRYSDSDGGRARSAAEIEAADLFLSQLGTGE